MAAAGIAEADWYALARQPWFTNMELFDQTTNTATPAGRTFAVLQDLLSRGEVHKIATDDFTYAYAFGAHAAIVWGESRTLNLPAGTRVLDLAGREITGSTGQIDPDQPLMVIVPDTVLIDGALLFGDSDVIGDSYHQFDVSNPLAGSVAGFEGPWSYFAQSGTGKTTALQTMGGGHVGGEPWTPYLGLPSLRPLTASATSVAPVDFSVGTNPASSYSVIERFTASTAQTVLLSSHWDVQDSTVDGVTISIRKNATTLFETVLFNPSNGNVLNLDLGGITLAPGDTLDFIVGANRTSAGGDVTERRIQIFSDPDVELPTTGAGTYNMVTVAASTVRGTVLADFISAAGWADGKMSIYGLAGSDTLIGGVGGDMLNGDVGDDVLRGLEGNDTLIGGNGNDVLMRPVRGWV